MNSDLLTRIETLQKLLPEAGAIFLKYLDSDKLNVEEKDKNDFVTQADKDIENYLSKNLLATFSGDSILGEEYGSVDGSNNFQWIIDPIDGSNNYARRIVDARIMVALAKDSTILYAAIYNPERQELYHATLGKGAHVLNLITKKESPITVSSRAFGQSMVIYTAGLAKGDQQSLDILQNIVGKIGGIRLYGSAAIAFELIASGRADCFICNIAKPMDMAAGYLMVREAGGEVLNFTGSNWTLNDVDILVTNKNNKQDFLQAVHIG